MAKCGTTVSRLPFGHIYLTPHMRLQARFACGQKSGHVNIMSDIPPPPPRLKKLSGHGKMIDPRGRLLHHERPFTGEGSLSNYAQ